ncbi:MAG: DUF692 domain-containing protein [Pirellulales bacterium]|nr:DUF692 domain-containing protein [Pirellulales bacterium]
MIGATKTAFEKAKPRPLSETRSVPAIGYALFEENRHVLDDPALNAVEITFERAADPLRLGRCLGELDFAYVSVHALQLSPASPDPPARAYLDALRALAEENGAAAVSDHLGFTRDGTGGVEMGHFTPPPFTAAALDATCRNLDLIQDYFRGRPFFLENIASLFHFRGTMSEAEFLTCVLQRTGCGWLLDVTNLYANARNHGYDASEFLRRVVPAARRLQMHLSGGFFDAEAGLYIDSHSRAVPEEVWALYRQALELGRGKVAAVFIERDQDFPDEAGWRAEVRKARRIAEETEVRA